MSGAAVPVSNRLPDGSANVHLAVAAVLQGARLGVVDALDCPDPLIDDGFEVNTDVHSAHNLKDALADLSADTRLQEAVGQDVCDNFWPIKKPSGIATSPRSANTSRAIR